MQWEWNDKIGSRGRKPGCIVALPNGDCYNFAAAAREAASTGIPGVAEIVNRKYQQNGKWSNTTYTVLSPDGTKVISWVQSWEEGLFFPQTYWHEAIAWIRSQAPQVSAEQAEAFIRRCFAKVAEKFDANQEAAARLNGSNGGRETLIVTRHAGMVEWLALHGYTGNVLAQVKRSDVIGKVVVGVLPMHLAAVAAEIVTVDMPGLTPEQRGQDLTPAEMDAAGATISRYVVTKIES